ncbi:hypothetical protein Q7P37_001316 [Cladosporium fusiforme]
MADRDWNGLPYGHFGTAIYQAEENTWHFEKTPNQPRVLEQIGDPKIVAPSPSLPNPTAPTDLALEPLHIRQSKQIHDVVRSNPGLQPATPLLGSLHRTSDAVVAASERHDSTKGSLLSFGRIFDERTRRSTQVATFATGPTGGDVRVVQVQLQKQGWNDSKDVWLEVPVVAGEEATWSGGGAPVLQVCFAQPLESGECLLAIRTSCRTLIFKPVLKKSGPDRLQLRLLFELGITDMGEESHSDVAFNPWLPRQFAVIDQSARWKVWEFSNRESSHAACISSSIDEEENTWKTALNDGWARIQWICNPSTVLIATRHVVSLYDVSSDSLKLQDLELNVSETSGWLLDMCPVPFDPARALVLTTTHMHLVLVEERNGDPKARSVMRIRHFQNPEDVSLRLTLHRNEEGTLTVVIRSSLNTTLVAYMLDLESHSPVLHDPARFQMKTSSSGSLDTANNLELHLQSISIAEKRSANVEDTLAGRLRAGDCRFLSLTALAHDLTISNLLYLDRPSEYRTSEVHTPTWSNRLTGTTSKIKDKFVTDEPQLASELFDQMNEPVAAYIKQRREHANRLSGLEWTLQHEHTAREIEQSPQLASNVMDILAQVRDFLGQATEVDTAVTRTVLELSNGELTIQDMDAASAQMGQLTVMSPSLHRPEEQNDDAVTHSMKFTLTCVPCWQSSKLPANSFTGVYDSIVSHWISPLSASVPGRVRLAKEQLARRLAADITLASHVLQPEEIAEPAETQQDGKPETQSHSWELPVRGAEASQASQFSNTLASQSALPTPSPTGTPSVTTASSRNSAFSSAEVARLRKYAVFNKPAPSSLPRSLNKILSHWTPGTDPATYDWISTSRKITQQTQEEEADSQLTEKQRSRLHRKAERHIRRQRKEAAASQQQHLASSQMPELVVSASQPHTTGGRSESQRLPVPGTSFGGMVGSSQSIAPIAASQAVAGRFGGGVRPPVKKKRKQGF